ncbi:MAG: DUF2975 domain-containing protein [Clostridia bacterium]|nr:DUF2975 domain-containing protein [Clostridia bacterium]
MYTSVKSTKLTLYVTYGFCVLLAGMMIGVVPALNWIFGTRQFTNVCVIAFYTCTPAAWTALISIIKLLKNVLTDRIFSVESVKILRLLSWCCAFVSVVSFIAMFFFRLLFVFWLGAGLMMLILRVLKNVLARAVEIKEENELTV